MGAVTRNDVEPTAATPTSAETTCESGPAGDWTWPPYAPLEPAEVPRFCIEEWAPASTVRRPWVRVGRWGDAAEARQIVGEAIDRARENVAE